METAEVLRKIKGTCTKQNTCRECPLNNIFCEIPPEHWTNKEIEDITNMLDNYEEEEK